MSRTAAKVVLALVLVLVIAGLLWLAGREGRRRAGGRSAGGTAPVTGPQEQVAVELYFPGPGGRLHVERRTVQAAVEPKQRIRAIVGALLQGPRRRGLARAFPEGVEVGGVLLAADGTAYVDLRWADHPEPPAGGSTAEMQSVYSVVDTVGFNVPQAQRVVLLWNGSQRTTFAGHLDTGRPIAPDRLLVAP